MNAYVKEDQPVESFVIADRSGSMESIRDDAIGGFNSFLEEQQKVDGKANLTLVLFDDRYEVPVKSVDIRKVKPLTRKTFVPRGMTAMNDAIGKAVAELFEIAPEKAVVCIITDGAENSSKEFTNQQVKDKIKEVEAKGWQVVFLAANIDAFSAGGSLGINSATTFGFAANAKGVQDAYATMSASTRAYRTN
ncbi:von Willebrand factor type A domain protein [compost metagenome]